MTKWSSVSFVVGAGQTVSVDSGILKEHLIVSREDLEVFSQYR